MTVIFHNTSVGHFRNLDPSVLRVLQPPAADGPAGGELVRPRLVGLAHREGGPLELVPLLALVFDHGAELVLLAINGPEKARDIK